MKPATIRQSTLDTAEIKKFSALADEWWNPNGSFKPLHKFSPVRLSYIKEKSCEHFNLNKSKSEVFQGLRFLDIGCGGGLLSEPMARLGADVVGVDPSHSNVEVAKLHAEKMGLSITYLAATAEEMQKKCESFDVVLNMEVVEHVADVPLFISQCASLVRPGGLMFVATINRTLKAYLLAIVGAERILGWLPKGTHSYEKLVKPEELEEAFKHTGLLTVDRCGVIFNPLQDCWKPSKDMDVNYMVLAKKPG